MEFLQNIYIDIFRRLLWKYFIHHFKYCIAKILMTISRYLSDNIYYKICYFKHFNFSTLNETYLEIWHKNREKGGQENLFYLKYVSHLTGRSFFFISDITKIIIFKGKEKKAESKRSWNSSITEKKKLRFEDLVSGDTVLLKLFLKFWVIRFSTIFKSKI